MRVRGLVVDDDLPLIDVRRQTHSKIDGYNTHFDEGRSAEDRNADYASLADSYYDLATEFYEWGWGTSFHFADWRRGETFQQSILRHEYYLAGRCHLGSSRGRRSLVDVRWFSAVGGCGGLLGLAQSASPPGTGRPPILWPSTEHREARSGGA